MVGSMVVMEDESVVSSWSLRLLPRREPKSIAREFRRLTAEGSLVRELADDMLGISVSLAMRLKVFVRSLTLMDFSFSLLGRVSKLSKLTELSILEKLASSNVRFPNDFERVTFLGGRESENLEESSVNPESVGEGCCDSIILGGMLVDWERDL